MSDLSEQACAEWIQQHCGPNCYGEQDENGIDLSLIRENLKASPLERIRRGESAMHSTLKLLEVGRQQREKLLRAAR